MKLLITILILAILIFIFYPDKYSYHPIYAKKEDFTDWSNFLAYLLIAIGAILVGIGIWFI